MLREEGPGDRQHQSMGLITANHFCVFSLFPNPWTLLPFWSCPSPSFSDHFSPRVPATLLHLYSRPRIIHCSLPTTPFGLLRGVHGGALTPPRCPTRSVSFSYSRGAPWPQTRWTRQSASGRPSSTAGAPTWCTGRTSSTTTASRSAAQTCDPGGGPSGLAALPEPLAVYILFI